MTKKFYIILLVFLLSDLGYSFYQHYHMPLYGDMAEIINPTPTKGDYQVLHDPFGLNVLLNNKFYPNPNRFFAHWFTSKYFLNMPFLLQRFITPVDSIYLSCAIVKILIQILFIYLLAVYISNTGNILKSDFLIAATLITPLFQTSGYNRFMGIIDQSVIYTFFYALPLVLLLLFFLPFFKVIYYNKIRFNFIIKILLIILIIIITLNGPLVPGVVLIICPLILFKIWLKNYLYIKSPNTYKRILYSIKKIPNYIIFYFLGICILSLYSLYIGKNNSHDIGGAISLIERYSRLPIGIYNLITQKLGLPLLLLIITINLLVISKHYKSVEAQKILNFIKWIGIFAILYILLLPIGGFRIYRANIIRYDTIMPITLGLMFIFGITSFYLFKNISKKYKRIYVFNIIIFLLIFTCADKLNTKNYECEKQALETISQSSEKIIFIDCDCPIMDWRKINDYNLSIQNAELFNYWNITKEKRLYYQKGE